MTFSGSLGIKAKENLSSALILKRVTESLELFKNSKLPFIFFISVSDYIYSTFLLKPRASLWTSESTSPSETTSQYDAAPAIQPSNIAEAVVITLPWAFEKSPTPVTKKNRDEWTDAQREKAKLRLIPKDLEDLQRLVCFKYSLCYFTN